MGIFDISSKLTHWRQQKGFERRLEAQLPAMMRAAYGFVSQQSDAEDLVHDTCVRALASYDAAVFENDAGLAAWLRRIMVNIFRDQYRREQRSPLTTTEYHATSDDYVNVVELVANTELSPLQSIENRNSSSAIQYAISRLPPEVRVVSVLFLISEFSYKEIAYITDSPIGTVMSRLSRGRQFLRKQLAAYDPQQPGSRAGGSHESM